MDRITLIRESVTQWAKARFRRGHNPLVKCVDCGFCGVHDNMGERWMWYTMHSRLQSALLGGRDYNPGRMVPGTGNWTGVACFKKLHEWVEGTAVNREALVERLSKDRRCDGFTIRRSGYDPPSHLFLDPTEVSIRSAKSGNRIAVWGLVTTILVLILGIVTLIRTL